MSVVVAGRSAQLKKMNRSAHRGGQMNGFESGFKLEKNDWLKSFQKSEWSKYENERNLNEEKFKIQYLKQYENGMNQRQQIQKEFQLKLELITSQDKEIQNKYLHQVFDIFYGTSYLFNSWEERINKEIFPQNKNSKSTKELRNKIANLIETKRYQKSLQYLKELFLKEQNSKFYHKILQMDSVLQTLRVKSKSKEINKNEYQIGLLKIENQLSEIKNQLEK